MQFNVKSLAGKIHALLGRNSNITGIAVSVRNQANAIVAAHFSQLSVSSDPAINGEYKLLDFLAPNIEFFIDVGANEGNWTARLVRENITGSRGVLYDANLECVQTLTRRFGDFQGLTIASAAVADFTGATQFFESDANSELSSLSANNAGDLARCRSVAVVTLDDEALRRHMPQVSFLKIDAEGHDYFVLRGARGLLQQKRIDIIQFECNSTWRRTGTTLSAAVNFLREYGYTTLQLRPTGLHSVDFEFYGGDYGYGNWVAFHSSARSMVTSLVR